MLCNLKLLRTKNGVTQRQLADAVGVSQQSINKYENHNIEPDIKTLISIADYFQTTIDYLVGRTDSSDGSYHINSMDKDELAIINDYRALSLKEKESIRLVLDNYIK